MGGLSLCTRVAMAIAEAPYSVLYTQQGATLHRGCSCDGWMHTAKRVHWFLSSELLHMVGNKNDKVSWVLRRSRATCIAC